MTTINKNFFFAPWASGLGATRRAAVLLLVMMLTATTAWATDKTLSGSESYTAQNGDGLDIRHGDDCKQCKNYA